MKPKLLSQEEFEYVYSKVPRFCVDVIIKTSKGIILTKRTIEPARGLWHIPGATLLKDEQLKNAAKRVAKTELGIDVVVEKMLGVIEYKYSKKYPRQDITVVFLTHPKNNNFKLKIDKHADDVGIFKKFPRNTIKQQVDFIKKYKILK